jgi:hypothetical protein
VTPTQKQAMQAAIDALEISLPARCADQPDGLYLQERDKHRTAITALRAALAEPVGEPGPYDQQALDLCDVCGWKASTPFDGCFICNKAALSEPVVEPVEFTRFLTDVVTAAGLLSHGRTDKGLAARIAEASFKLRAAPPPPAGVPLLNRETIDNEIQQHVDPVATYGGLHNFARAIEQAVHKKAGIL